jgi:multidrug efflux pump subunit AcrB
MNNSRGLIAYFAHNTVAANLIMIFIIIMGVLGYFTIQRQMFPQPELNTINIQVSNAGAAPQEIEESIIIKIEQALESVAGIKEIHSRSFRNGGSVTVKLDNDQDVLVRLDEIKLQLDSIANFPATMEPLVVYKTEIKQTALQVMLVGSEDDKALKKLGLEIEEELRSLKSLTFIKFESMPAYEISVEVKPEVLRKYNLTLNDISLAIRSYSKNISAGTIKTDNGIISLRYENRAYSQQAFAQIPILTGQHGERVLLGDVANIIDGFEDRLNYMRYNGKNATYIGIRAGKEQSLTDVAQAAKQYIAFKNEQLPEGYKLHVLVDMTYYLNGRLTMMLENLFLGGMLVFLILAIFLRTRLAFWVMIGLPVTFLGAFWLMPLLGISINIMSLFAFIMVLGIVVDDAIVIGEGAYSETEKKGHSVDNIVRGAKRVATPATFGVLTTIAVFMPFMFSSGSQAALFQSIAGVVILCLVFSLIESKLILPAHLAHSVIKPLPENHWRKRLNGRITHFIEHPYNNFLNGCIKHRYAALSAFIILLVLSIALIASGTVRTVMMPKVPHDFPTINIEMNKNVTERQTLSVLKMLEQVIVDVDKQIISETGKKIVRDIFVMANNSTSGEIVVPLVDEELRPFDTFELAKRWRENFPELVGVKSIKIIDSVGPMSAGDDISYRIFGKNLEELNHAARALMKDLTEIDGLYDVGTSVDPSIKELQLKLKPVAYQLGLNPEDITRQLGGSFYGFEAQRILRDREDIKVMVRSPKADREKISQLNLTLITLANGEKSYLGDLAEFVEKPGVSQINREFGHRSVTVFASLDESEMTNREAMTFIDEQVISKLLEEFPSITTKIGGAFEEQQKQNVELLQFMLTGLLAVYLLLAFPLKSYSQPLVIMSVIPFSLTGAVLGHYLLGFELSMMSIFGVIAAAGVVVNDSLVLTDHINQTKKNNVSNKQACIAGSKSRFRAIILTSLTTFLGLIPIMFDSSLQAQMVIPMAISLAFSVLYATLITLVLVPCFYVIKDDLQRVLMKVFKGNSLSTKPIYDGK